MTNSVICANVFMKDLKTALVRVAPTEYWMVTGPGRSGAITSAFASHITGIPFMPFGHYPEIPKGTRRLLIIDTSQQTGKTLRKARNRYKDYNPVAMSVYYATKRLRFWYENS